MKRRLFFLLAFVSVFLISSMSFIPSVQSSIFKEEKEEKYHFINEINDLVNRFSNQIGLFSSLFIIIEIVFYLFIVYKLIVFLATDMGLYSTTILALLFIALIIDIGFHILGILFILPITIFLTILEIISLIILDNNIRGVLD